MMRTAMRKLILPNIGNRTYPASGIRRRADSEPARKQIRAAGSAFNSLLLDRIHGLRKDDAPYHSTAPLSGPELHRIITRMRTRMNSAFFQALDDPDSDSPPPADSLRWMGSFSINHRWDLLASENQHAARRIADPALPANLDEIIDHASKTYGIDSDLINAVIRAESDHKPDSTSPKGAMGLMQLMPETAEDLGVKDPYDPVENVMAGSRYLKTLLNRYHQDIPLALAAYNWGMGNIERHPDALPEETKTYIARVDKYYREKQWPERSSGTSDRNTIQ